MIDDDDIPWAGGKDVPQARSPAVSTVPLFDKFTGHYFTQTPDENSRRHGRYYGCVIAVETSYPSDTSTTEIYQTSVSPFVLKLLLPNDRSEIGKLDHPQSWHRIRSLVSNFFLVRILLTRSWIQVWPDLKCQEEGFPFPPRYCLLKRIGNRFYCNYFFQRGKVSGTKTTPKIYLFLLFLLKALWRSMHVFIVCNSDNYHRIIQIRRRSIGSFDSFLF